jgi:hypothetical protein
MNWTLVSAVNNDTVLNSCLLQSGAAQAAVEVILQRGYADAAGAYNNALERATSDVVVFAHQDVYLPANWATEFSAVVGKLNVTDPKWAVLGVYGVRQNGEHIGHVYDTGVSRLLGQPFQPPQLVSSLDELLLVVRKSSGLRFDAGIGGYHFYGTDICLEAQRQGLKSYAISAFCIHNTNGYRTLPWPFWGNFLRMRRKWRAVLPVTTSCIEITPWCWPAVRWNMIRGVNLLLHRHKVGQRQPAPDQLYRELVATNQVRPAVREN